MRTCHHLMHQRRLPACFIPFASPSAREAILSAAALPASMPPRAKAARTVPTATTATSASGRRRAPPPLRAPRAAAHPRQIAVAVRASKSREIGVASLLRSSPAAT